jgi:glycosyltransferase involved in cell wall biosynthesis
VEAGKVKLLQNGIDTAAFAYNAALRNKARLALGIGEEQRAIGMVARFSPQKDHAAALRIFAAYHKENPNAVLLLVGDGPLRCEIEREARALLPTEAVRFLGVREDTPALYAAMDAFLLSSRFEGFPMSLVEAQTSGLPSAVSDTVSAETAITDLVRFLPVAEPQRWCAALDAVPAHPRGDYAVKMAERGFSLQTAAEELAEFYLKS